MRIALSKISWLCYVVNMNQAWLSETRQGDVEQVRHLLEAGADGSIRGTGAPGFYNKTAFMLAEERGQREVVEWLKVAGTTE